MGRAVAGALTVVALQQHDRRAVATSYHTTEAVKIGGSHRLGHVET